MTGHDVAKEVTGAVVGEAAEKVVGRRPLAFLKCFECGFVVPNFSFGRFSLNANGAYFIESYTVSDPGGPRIQRLERNGAARWRGDASVFWRKGGWNAGVSAYYIGSTLDTGMSKRSSENPG